MRVLYVEDNPADVELTVLELSKAHRGISVEAVPTRGQAIECLNESRGKCYDLALLDCSLPDGDGMSILEFIREEGLPLAVVIVTGTGDEETEAAAFKAGADDFIHKTGNYRGRLWETLENALECFRLRILSQSDRAHENVD